MSHPAHGAMQFKVSSSHFYPCYRLGALAALRSGGRVSEGEPATVHWVKIDVSDRRLCCSAHTEAISSVAWLEPDEPAALLRAPGEMELPLGLEDGETAWTTLQKGDCCVLAWELEKDGRTLSRPHNLEFQAKSARLIVQARRNSHASLSWDYEAQPVSRFPTPSFLGGPPSLSIPPGELARALQHVQCAVAHEDYRGAFSYLALLPSEHGCLLAACDGDRAALSAVGVKFHLPPDEVFAQRKPILIKARLLKEILGLLPDSSAVDLSCNGGDLQLHGARWKVRTSLPPADVCSQFPNLARFRQMPVSVSVDISSAGLLQVAQTAARRSPIVRLTVAGGTEYVGLDYSSSHESARLACAPVERGLGNPIALSAVFLADALRRLKAKRVTLEFSADESKCRLRDPHNPQVMYLMQRMRTG